MTTHPSSFFLCICLYIFLKYICIIIFFYMPALTLLLWQGMWLPASCRPSIAVEKVRGLLGALGVGKTNGGCTLYQVQQYQDLLLFTCSLLSSFCFCSVMSSSFSCFEPRRVRAVNEYKYVPMLIIKIQKYKFQKYKNVWIRLKYLRTM